MSEAQLPYVPQALELLSINDLGRYRVKSDRIPQGIPNYFSSKLITHLAKMFGE